MRATSVWGRWHWKEGPGRWHAIVGPAEDIIGAVSLACGRVRVPPTITADRPADQFCCPTCLNLDNYRLAMLAGVAKHAKEPVLAGETS